VGAVCDESTVDAPASPRGEGGAAPQSGELRARLELQPGCGDNPAACFRGHYDGDTLTVRTSVINGLGWLIDTRPWGAYVVAPGSVTPDGRYEYLFDGPPAPLPGWDRLTPATPPAAPVLPIRPARGRRARYLDVAIRAEAGKVADASTNRNATLFAAAVALGQLVAGGAVSEEEVRAALMTAAGRHIGTRHFTAREATTTITSGLKTGANRPRRIA
jgi:hypothetical protein